MVSVARDAKNAAGAQEYARQCWNAEQKSKSLGAKMLGLFKADPLPTGLYAECVARLGDIPPPSDAQSPTLTQMPANAINGLRENVEKGK
jgi:hypothetical protein